MLSLLVSLLAGAVVFVALLIPFNWLAAIFPGLVVAVVVYALIARRVGKRLETGMLEVQKTLMARRFDQAKAQLIELRKLGRWQFLVGSVIDSQIGTILYAYENKPDEAVPYLERSYPKAYQARLMLAAHWYRKGRFDDMVKVFEDTVKVNKKAALAWNAYAWAEWKRGQRQKAMDVLARAQKHLPDEERTKSNLLALQNDRRMKMKSFAEEWWALQLERPPMQMMAPGGGRAPRGMRPRRR